MSERSALLKAARFMVIGAIPSDFHSSDLREHFSHFIERKGFVCFHYKHRPEVVKVPSKTQSSDPSSTGDASSSSSSEAVAHSNTNCCVVAVASRLHKEFIKSYNGKNWSRPGGELLAGRVRINRLEVSDDSSSTVAKGDLNVRGGEPVPWAELAALPELSPPNAMPQGNVGTPLSVFMELIRTCKLPAHVIKKLRLEFPKSRTSKRYGAVAHDYETTIIAQSGPSEDESDELPGPSSKHPRKYSNSEEEDKEESIPSDDEHDAEEWERYEALHDDVDKQGRTKERLFENELEVVWDKGSSGLVFYTDASYWDQQEGDFDEKCATEDDWDVDTSIYYDADGGDRSAQELRDMARESRLREGREEVAGSIGGFEKYTKGIGKKVLKRSGWQEGSGVGASRQGIPEPVDTEGQHPHSKRGLGYHGEKLNRWAPSSKRQKANRDFIISTVYDNKEDSVTMDTSATSKAMKYRAKELLGQRKFLDGGTLRPPSSS